MQRDRGRPHAALGAGDGDELAAERAAWRTPRPRPGRASCATTGRRSGRWPRRTRARAGARRRRAARPASRRAAGPASPRRRAGSARPRGRRTARSRARSSTGVPPSASWSRTTSTSSRRSARWISSSSPTMSTTSISASRACAAARRAVSSSATAISSRALIGSCRPSAPSGPRRGRSSRRACGRRGRRGAAARAGRRRRTTDACATFSDWRLSSANVTGTTSPGSAGASWTPLAPFSRGVPTLITSAPGTITIERFGLPAGRPRHPARRRRTRSRRRCRPGWIRPATPVEASTRIATSRWPSWSCGGVTSMPSCRIESGCRSEPATWPIELRVVGTARPPAPTAAGPCGGRTALSGIASFAATGRVSSSTTIFVADLGLDLRDVVRDQREHAHEAKRRDREQEHRTSLSRIHPPPCRLRQLWGSGPER